MKFGYCSAALLCGALLLGSCGDQSNSPALPGPVQVSSDFVSAREYLFTPGSVFESVDLRLDFINPRFDSDEVIVRNTPQGSGEARQEGIEASIESIGDLAVARGETAVPLGNVLSLQLSNTIPNMQVLAFAPDDALLRSEVDLSGLVLTASNLSDQRLRIGSSFRAIGSRNTTNSTLPIDTNIDTDVNPDRQVLGETNTNLVLTIENIYVSPDGSNVVLEGVAALTTPVNQVLNTVTGAVVEGSEPEIGTVTNPDGSESQVLIPGEDAPEVVFEEGRFSASFVVRDRGIEGPGTDANALSLLARLHFVPNQAEITYTPAQPGSLSVLYGPDPTRQNVLPNQLVRIERLLNGRVQATFDPANVSTVLNFIQVSPPSRPFPTPIPQLPEGESTGTPPDAFDYFFSMRTERNDEAVRLEGFAALTGDFIFRNLAGAQLSGPFGLTPAGQDADISGGAQNGNLNLVFDQDFDTDGIQGTEDDLTGQFFLEQQFPTSSAAGDAGGGQILIIRGFFNGPLVRL